MVGVVLDVEADGRHRHGERGAGQDAEPPRAGEQQQHVGADVPGADDEGLALDAPMGPLQGRLVEALRDRLVQHDTESALLGVGIVVDPDVGGRRRARQDCTCSGGCFGHGFTLPPRRSDPAAAARRAMARSHGRHRGSRLLEHRATGRYHGQQRFCRWHGPTPRLHGLEQHPGPGPAGEPVPLRCPDRIPAPEATSVSPSEPARCRCRCRCRRCGYGCEMRLASSLARSRAGPVTLAA